MEKIKTLDLRTLVSRFAEASAKTASVLDQEIDLSVIILGSGAQFAAQNRAFPVRSNQLNDRALAKALFYTQFLKKSVFDAGFRYTDEKLGIGVQVQFEAGNKLTAAYLRPVVEMEWATGKQTIIGWGIDRVISVSEQKIRDFNYHQKKNQPLVEEREALLAKGVTYADLKKEVRYAEVVDPATLVTEWEIMAAMQHSKIYHDNRFYKAENDEAQRERLITAVRRQLWVETGNSYDSFPSKTEVVAE